MSMRAVANRNARLVGAIVVVLVLVSGWIIVRQAKAMFSPNIPGGAYYSTDDGKTWFKGDYNKITPFDSGGKEAVEAHVFTCDGKEFVAYLSRFNPQAKKAIEDFNASRSAGKPVDAELGRKMAFASMAGKEYKRPGDAKWVPQSQSAEISKLTAPKCDDGSEAVRNKL